MPRRDAPPGAQDTNCDNIPKTPALSTILYADTWYNGIRLTLHPADRSSAEHATKRSCRKSLQEKFESFVKVGVHSFNTGQRLCTSAESITTSSCRSREVAKQAPWSSPSKCRGLPVGRQVGQDPGLLRGGQGPDCHAVSTNRTRPQPTYCRVSTAGRWTASVVTAACRSSDSGELGSPMNAFDLLQEAMVLAMDCALPTRSDRASSPFQRIFASHRRTSIIASHHLLCHMTTGLQS